MHRTRNVALVVFCAAALFLSFTLPHAWAQKKPNAKTKSVEKNGDALFSSASAPNPDPVFAEKVKEYTTEPYFRLNSWITCRCQTPFPRRTKCWATLSARPTS